MNKTLITATVAGIVLLASNAQAQTVPEGYQLQQVLMMSRHNLRAPLANNGSVLEQSTPNKWPEWDVPGGQLTTKGGVLEVYMGHYMREWLAEQGMVKSGECPPPDTVYAYANSLQRTVATAQFFITGAFPGGDIPVHSVKRRWRQWRKSSANSSLPTATSYWKKSLTIKIPLPVKRNNSVRWWMAKIPLARSINKNQVFPGR